ncbi:MAG TPA: hypothetical protein VFX59_30225, partial [Polyangiales bacterium]|nr:hypothetical protein [Polyangiales bacterium]
MKRLLLALCAFVLLACPSESEEQTTLTLTITSDLRVPTELDLVTVRVAGQETENDPVADLLEHGLPRTLTLVHESGPLGPFPITVRGYRGTELVIKVDTSASFPVRGNTDLTVHLDRTCFNVACGPSDVCEAGKCVPRVPPEDAGMTVRDAGPRDARVDAQQDAQLIEDAALDASVPDADAEAPPVDAGVDSGAGTPPTCTITLPIPGDTYQNGVLFPLQGTCSDPETGALSELTWLSSRDGLLGNGAAIEARVTSAGMHRVSLCAPDPRDATVVGCASADIEG